MQTGLAHLQINVARENLSFYTELLTFLGWQSLHADDEVVGLRSREGVSFWFFAGQTKAIANDYDGPGLNHFAIGADSQADVDRAADYLRERDITLLFDTPRHRPDYATSTKETYYQIMFETPDRLLIEVVYTGPHRSS